MLLAGGAATFTAALGSAASWRASEALLRPSPLTAPVHVSIDTVVPGPPDIGLHGRFGWLPGATVALSGRAAATPGIWGLQWDDGGGILGPSPPGAPPARGAGPASRSVTRSLLLVHGTLPVGDGSVRGELRAAVWPDDPALGPVPVHTRMVDGPLGPLPCWTLDGRGENATTCVIAVHGRAAAKAQLWRHLAALAPLGVSAVVPAYRNDPGAPVTGLYELGTGEWADIEAVIADALGRGARRIVLVGLSMGGAIVAKVLAHTTYGDAIRGVVLDSPVLDWAAVLGHVARGRRSAALLRPLAPLVLSLSARRAGLDRKSLRMVLDADRLDAPVLLIHGDLDPVVPVATSDELAALRPDLIRYVRIAGGGHVNTWNADPDRYDTVLRDFVIRCTSRPQRDNSHGATA